MKTLPKYFAIEFKESPLWEKYVKWINEKYDEDWEESNAYWNEGEKLGFDEDGCDFHYLKSNFSKGTKFITLEEWDSIVNGTHKTASKNLTYETQYLRSDGTLFTKRLYRLKIYGRFKTKNERSYVNSKQDTRTLKGS